MNNKWVWGTVLAGVTAFCLGCFLTWINLEIVSYSYQMQVLEKGLQQEKEIAARLKLEGQTLFSPNHLQGLARKMNLGLPAPGQIRTWE